MWRIGPLQEVTILNQDWLHLKPNKYQFKLNNNILIRDKMS